MYARLQEAMQPRGTLKELATPMLHEEPKEPIPSSGSSFLNVRKPSAEGGTASLPSCIINLASTCMGTGILALPAAYARAGLFAGSALCLGSAILAAVSLHLLDAAAERAGVTNPDFYKLCEAVLPRSGRAIDVAVVVNCFGSACAYLIVAGDSFGTALGSLGVARRGWVGGAVVLVAPLCFLKTMDALRVTSLLSVLCLLTVSLLVLAFGMSDSSGLFDACPGMPHYAAARLAAAGGLSASRCGGVLNPWGAAPLRVFGCLPIFVNAFTCQQNCFNVLRELNRPTRRRKLAVIGASVGLPALLYVLVATAGLLTYGETVASNVLNSFPRTPLVAAARVGLGVVVLCGFPLQAFPCRVSAASLLASCSPRAAAAEARAPALPLASAAPGGGAAPALFVSDGRELAATVAFLGGAAAVALTVSELGAVVGLVGATGATALALITPGGAYLLSGAGEAARSPLAPLSGALAACAFVLGVAILVGKPFL